MGFGSVWHWGIVLLVVVLLFGAGKLPKAMADVAKGIKSFKAGLTDAGDTAQAAAPDPSRALPAGGTASPMIDPAARR